MDSHSHMTVADYPILTSKNGFADFIPRYIFLPPSPKQKTNSEADKPQYATFLILLNCF